MLKYAYMKKQKYAFIDRDGTIIWEPEKPAGVDPQETFPLKGEHEFRFMKGAKENLKMLIDKGYKLVLVTNQTFLGTPKHPQDIFDAIMNRMKNELAAHGVSFEFVMICPHGPKEGCGCRKPKIGGLKQFIENQKGLINFAESYMFGDRDTDEQFAKNLGVKFVKIETNKEFKLPTEISMEHNEIKRAFK